ncbi:MAG TPA: universal stress protein [Caulobacterales bacterium]|nr:universal stress protein [Caulobacterales bacterium]
MAWRDILVFADGSEEAVVRARLALDLAHKHGAHCETRVITEAPPSPDLIGTPALEEAYQALLKRAREKGAAALEKLRKLARPGSGFSLHQQETPIVQVDRQAAIAARWSDLVVLGQPCDDREGDVDRAVLEGALFGGGAPCLILPRWIKPHEFGKRVVVAWKGTPQAARAARAALPLLREAQSVRLLVVDPRGEDDGEDRAALMRLATHFARHGVKLEEPVTTQSDLGEAGDAIAHELEEFNADMLVMGAYGHARASEFIFGGVSRQMIRNANVALVMAH